MSQRTRSYAFIPVVAATHAVFENKVCLAYIAEYLRLPELLLFSSVSKTTRHTVRTECQGCWQRLTQIYFNVLAAGSVADSATAFRLLAAHRIWDWDSFFFETSVLGTSRLYL